MPVARGCGSALPLGRFSRPVKILIIAIFLVSVLLTVCACFRLPREVPTQFRGEFSFNKSKSVTYWEAQSDWPDELKERLAKMAIPTTLRIEPDRVVVTDAASGRSVTQQARILHADSGKIILELHSNFARSSKATTFLFDTTGFWLCEDSLVSNYRERFEKVEKP
jgi:hypothetical protein